MNLTKLIAPLAVSALTAFAVTGCSGSVTAGATITPTPTDGTLSVLFTIAGASAPVQCATYNVDHLELVVLDTSGVPFTTVNANCEDFALSVTLPPGIYDADATLVDAAGRTASDTLPINNLNIVAGTTLTSDIDFPAGSIH